MLCLSIQLFLVGVWYLFKSRDKSLGIICLILGTGWIYSLYFPIFRDNIWANIILSGYKELALFPLFYLFFLSRIDKTDDLKDYVKHLTLPILISFAYLITKFVFKEFFGNHFILIMNTIRVLGFLILFWYSYLIVRFLFEKQTELKPGVSKRYTFIFSLFFIPRFLGHLEFVAIPFIDIDKQAYYILSFRYFWHPLNIIVSIVFLLFAISEIKGIHSFILGNKIHHHFDTINRGDEVKRFIQEELLEERLFLKPDFNIKQALADNNLSERDFRLTVKRDWGRTIHEFINKLKVEEFIKISQNENYGRYGMEGLYEMAGFNSKATFYRNFKKEMGVTPSDYLKNLHRRIDVH